MRSGLKAAVVLLVMLPVLAYVGSRLAAAPPDPGRQAPVILDGAPTLQPSPSKDDRRGARQDERPEDGPDDGPVTVVNPAPTRVSEDDLGTGDDEPDPRGDDETDDDTSDGDD